MGNKALQSVFTIMPPQWSSGVLNLVKKEKYRRTAEKKEIDYDAYLDEKLRNDMRETHKYLGKGVENI